MRTDTAPADFLATLLSGIGAPADPALDAHHDAIAALAAAGRRADYLAGAFRRALRPYGYTPAALDARNAYRAAVAAVRAAADHLDATPHPAV